MKTTRLVNALNDRMNPLVVKELRQSARSRVFIVTLTIFLGILLFIMGIIVSEHTSSSSGRASFTSVLAVLLLATMLFVPFYSATRLALERLGDNMDLLYITTLPPHKIVRGKWMAGMMLVILFFSAALPFLCLSYFLRGVDLPTILLLSIFAFIIVGTLLQAALCLAALLRSRIGMILLGLSTLVPLFSLYSMTMEIMDRMNSQGAGYLFISGEYWPEVGAFLLVDLFVFLAFYKINIALIKPQAMDRAKPVRLFLFFGWATIMGIFSLTSNSDLALTWMAIGVLITTLSTLIACSERDRPGRRVLADPPGNPLKRALLFPFSSGAANGIAWSFIMMISVYIFIDLNDPSKSELDQNNTLGSMLNIFCYVLTAHFIQRTFLIPRFKKITMQKTWITAIVLCALGSLLPLLGVFMLSGGHVSESNSLNLLFLPSLGLLFNNHYSNAALGTTVLWFIIMVVMEMNWLIARFNEYMKGNEASNENMDWENP